MTRVGELGANMSLPGSTKMFRAPSFRLILAKGWETTNLNWPVHRNPNSHRKEVRPYARSRLSKSCGWTGLARISNS
jgi:hypothetical protein